MIYPYCDEDYYEDINKELQIMFREIFAEEEGDFRIYIGSGEDAEFLEIYK